MKAKKIADLILKEPVETRGNLFQDIGVELNKSSQGYTGKLFLVLARQYGIK